MDLGPHAFYIVAAYGVTTLIVAGLIVRAVLDHRAQTRALADFADRGVGRRSDAVQGVREPQRQPPLRSQPSAQASP